MRKLINNNLKGRLILILFFIMMSIYGLMLLVTIPKVMEYSGGMKLLDMMPSGYSNEYILKLMNSLGEEGRNKYLTIQIPFDMIYPGLFAITWCLIFVYFLKKAFPVNKHFYYISFLPVIAGISDYLENAGIITILTSWPEQNFIVFRLTNYFSILKSVTTTIFFIALLILLIILAIKLINRKFITEKIG